MRPPRSSPCSFRPFEITDQKPANSAVEDATVLDSGQAHAAAGSKSAPGLPPLDPPAWVLTAADPRRRANNRARAEIDVPDHEAEDVRRDDGALLEGRQALSKRRGATRRATRLESLLTVAEAAAILNLSERTVRRLIASEVIPAVWIGRSVRLRPRDISRLIAEGVVCND